MGLFCEHSDVFSGTWPASGMTVAGTAYELPTSVPRMDGSGCSLLPTPTRADQERSSSRYPGGNLTLPGALLRTPNAYDGERGGTQHPEKRLAGGHQPSLADQIEWLGRSCPPLS